MSELTLAADHVVIGGLDGTVIENGVVTIADGIITSVTASTGARPTGPDVVDLGDSVLMPGLVNAHAHTPMSLMRGLSEGHSLLTMEGWLGAIRSREAHLTPELVPASVEVSCAEMIGSGTTSFADQYFFADEIAPVVERSGMRAAIAYGIVELGDDDARATGLAAAEAFIAAGSDHPIVRRWLGPHAFFVDNQLEAIEAELTIAHRFGVGMHTHFATSGEEDEQCLTDYGTGALEKMAELGLLDVPLLLAHCNDVRVDQLHFLAGTSATMVVNASVAMLSGAGAPPVLEALRAGVGVALGTDNWCGNNNADLFEEMRTLGKLISFARQQPHAITPTELLGLATWRGHRALGGGELDGTISAGAVADVIALPMRAVHRGPVGAQSLISSLVYGTSGFATTDVMVSGRWLKRDGVLTTVDRDDARRRQQRDFETLIARELAAATS